MAARTEEEILQSYQDNAKLADETVDVEKGPLYSLIAVPLAATLQPTEAEAERLSQIYSIDFAKTASVEDSKAFLTNWSESAGGGSPSTVRVFFLKFSRPLTDEVITIPVGATVGNSDQSLQYVTVESASIIGSQADVYFNAGRRAYETSLLVQAVANGTQYDLPRGRINAKITQLDGIDQIENREDATGGIEAETTEQQITRVQDKFTGLAINTAAGNFTRVKRYDSARVLDVKPVLSTDRQLFRRIVRGPGTDYYILGTNLKTVNTTYTATGGETLIPAGKSAVQTVNTVKINNVPISNVSLIPDTSAEFGYSAQAFDQVLLPTVLLAGDVVVTNLTYNALLESIQLDIFGEIRMFETSELARSFREVGAVIELVGKSLPTHDPSTVARDCRSALQTILEPGVWQQEFTPTEVLDRMKATVSGLTGSAFTRFQRSTLALDTIETLVVQDNEIIAYNDALVIVTIRNV